MGFLCQNPIWFATGQEVFIRIVAYIGQWENKKKEQTYQSAVSDSADILKVSVLAGWYQKHLSRQDDTCALKWYFIRIEQFQQFTSEFIGNAQNKIIECTRQYKKNIQLF